MPWYQRVASRFAAGTRRSLAGNASVATVLGGSSWLLLGDDGDHSLFSKRFIVGTNATTDCEAAAAPKVYYTAEQVAENNGKNHKETWVSYQGKVYNITNFIKEHPGGDFILDAAGGPIENYWAYWAYHTTFDRPKEFLKKYEIGMLQPDEDEEEESIENLTKEMYESDPDRKKCVSNGQVPLTVRPWCSETAPHLLASPFTPNDAFYVRNHAPVPVLDSENHDITMECDPAILGGQQQQQGGESTQVNVSLESLQKMFPVVTIYSVLQCAGNRGGDMVQIAPTAFVGTPYEKLGVGMMGHASWTGVRLVDVLMHAFPRLDDNMTEAQLDSYHVEFEGVDGYKTSTPLRRILDKSYDAILAWEMNGKALPPDHGGPVRVFLPGIAGARNVKWVHAIRIQPQECTSCFQKTYYLDYHYRAIQEMPMQCFMISKKKIKNKNKLHVAGVAWGGGSGVGISRVEVSNDGGQSWKDATLHKIPRRASASSREWSWVRFEADFDLDGAKRDAPLPTVTSRAYDGTGLLQPEKLWYPKGYLSHGWHRL